MKRFIPWLMLTAGLFLLLASMVFAQSQFVSHGRVPDNYPEYKLNVAEKFYDNLRVLVIDQSILYCMSGDGSSIWEGLFGISWANPRGRTAELLANQSGQMFIYDGIYDSLYLQWNVAIEGRYCPGRPVIDAAGAIHVLWPAPDSDVYYYGLSIDSLESFGFLDTLSMSIQYVRLVASPDDSLVCAIVFREYGDSLYKYLAPAGQPLNFTLPTETFDVPFPYGHDIIIDFAGNIYSVGFDVTGCPLGWYCHRAWIEDIGYRFIAYATDDVNDGTAFQFSFGDSGRVLLVRNGTPPWGYLMDEFFVSNDFGSTWHQSVFRLPPQYYNFYASMPRAFDDTIHCFYYSASSYWGPFDVYYYPIPRDSIFENLLSVVDNAPLPVNMHLSSYPNPFNGETILSFAAPVTSEATIEVFDITGRLIAMLYDGSVGAAAMNVTWDAKDFNGKPLPSGAYLARLKVGRESISHKMLFLK